MERTEPDLALFKATFERNGSPRTLQHLKWQYLNNPTGKLYVDFAIPQDDRSRAAAIYSVMPVHFRVSGQRMLGVQSLDTLTDADFRGKGLFTKLAQQVFERCRLEGVCCVYGFPNANSAPGFFRKLEWTRLDPVPFLVKPLRANYLLRRLEPLRSMASRLPQLPLALARRPLLPRSQEIRPISKFGSEFDTLWERFAQGVGVAVHRDAQYLDWRLRQKPDQRYRVVGLYENGKLLAFCAFDVQDKHGGRVGYILELIHEPGRSAEGTRLLQEAIAEMSSDGAEVVLAWCLDHSANRPCFREEGFFPLPQRLRPITLHVGVRSLAAPVESNLGNRRNWYLSYLDSDTV
jgi:GNAT superfamily N-acetyltransferase